MSPCVIVFVLFFFPSKLYMYMVMKRLDSKKMQALLVSCNFAHISGIFNVFNAFPAILGRWVRLVIKTLFFVSFNSFGG